MLRFLSTDHPKAKDYLKGILDMVIININRNSDRWAQFDWEDDALLSGKSGS